MGQILKLLCPEEKGCIPSYHLVMVSISRILTILLHLHPQSFSLSLVRNGTLSVSNFSLPQNTDYFYNVSSIYFTITNPLEVIVRQPTITMSNGQVTLNESTAVQTTFIEKQAQMELHLRY